MALRRERPKYLVIDGCPAGYDIAPYLYLVLRGAGQYATSIYRGDDPQAVKILHAYGKHTQAEIHADPRYTAISNPAGFSQHELKSDGPAANRGIALGDDIPEWMQGVDSGGDDERAKKRIEDAAGALGWLVVHPYNRGVEGHHWRFDKKPRPRGAKQRARIIYLRRKLRHH